MTTDTTALLKLADRMKFACEGREQYAMGRPRLDSWVMIWQQELRELAAASPADGGVLPPLPGYGIDTANHASVRILGYTDEQMHAYAREALAAAAPDAKRSCAVSGSSWGLNCDETLSWGTHDKECALYNAKDEELPLPSDVEANVSNATEPDTPEEAAMFDIGRKAWAGVPDNWVSKIRGHEADATPYEPDGSDAPIRDATPRQGAEDAMRALSGFVGRCFPQPTKPGQLPWPSEWKQPEADAGSTKEKTMIERIRAQSALAHTFMPYVQVVGLAEVEEVFFATDAQAGQGEALGDEVRNTLAGIAFANRRNKDVFDDDAAFVDWAQSIAKHVINKRAPPPARSTTERLPNTFPLPGEPIGKRPARSSDEAVKGAVKMKVFVPNSTSADDANRLYGEAYGVDWEYESDGSKIMALHDETMRQLAAFQPTENTLIPPEGDSFSGWAAWLRDRGSSFDQYIQGPMFNQLAAWLESLDELTPPPARSSDDAENDGVCGVVPGPHNWSIPQANGLLECLWCGLFKTARNRGTAEGGK